MEVQSDDPAEEIKRLQRCINDLVSVLALPAIWSGGNPSQIAHTLLDVLVGMLGLDFGYVRLEAPVGEAPIEVVRGAQSSTLKPQPPEIGELLIHCWGADPRKWGTPMRSSLGGADISIVPLRLGLQGEIGVIVAGSQRADFPGQTDKLLLSVAANQAAIGLQEARLRSQQNRVAKELDRRVAERTRELGAANEELKKEIADRKRAEEKLRRSEAYLHEAQRIACMGSLAHNISSETYTASPEFLRIFDLNPGKEKLTREMIRERVHPEDLTPLSEAVSNATREKTGFDFEYRIVLPDGSTKYVHTVAKPVFDASGALVEHLGTTLDMTERKRAEEASRQAQMELAHVNRVTTMGELTASLAHEVNQPIGAAVANAESCLSWLAGDTPNLEEARAAAANIVKDGMRAAEIITRVRLLFRKGTPRRELVNLNEIIRELLVLLRGEATRHAISVRTEPAVDLPQVMGDRVQLQQVMMNLIINGIDATKDVEGARELAIKSQRAENGQVMVSISDTGVGLPPRQVDRIFSAFFTTKHNGMGMGLSISRAIVESHGGHLWAEDNSPRGARFHLTVPTAVTLHP